MAGQKRIGRPAWFKGHENGHELEVGTAIPEGGNLITWYTTIDGDTQWHPSLWEAHAYADEQTKEPRS